MSAGEAWLPEGGVFVTGKPLTDIWAPAGLRWRDQLAAHLHGPLRNPCLRFVRKDRSQYDLDNLVYPVVAVSGCGACESIWAFVEQGDPEGVHVREAVPPAPPQGDKTVSVYIARPSRSAVAHRPAVPELETIAAFGNDESIGMALQFDARDVPVGELSFEGPIKSLVDDLTPLFGQRMIAGRLLAKDYRVRELRITRGCAPGLAGVTVTLWYLQ